MRVVSSGVAGGETVVGETSGDVVITEVGEVVPASPTSVIVDITAFTDIAVGGV